MYTDRKKNPLALAAVLGLLLIAGALFRAMFPKSAGPEENLDNIKRTVLERSLECYVVEGAYPPSLEYLEENYGLTINKKAYYIHFTAYAENLPPEVRVTVRNKG